jgi:hypothetical protein
MRSNPPTDGLFHGVNPEIFNQTPLEFKNKILNLCNGMINQVFINNLVKLDTYTCYGQNSPVKAITISCSDKFLIIRI